MAEPEWFADVIERYRLSADAVVRGRLDVSQAAWTRSRWTYLLDRNELDHRRFEARPDHVGSVFQSGAFGLLELE